MKKKKKRLPNRRRSKRFYQRLYFKIVVITGLFCLALYMKGEKLTLFVLGARIIDAIGDVVTDMSIHD